MLNVLKDEILSVTFIVLSLVGLLCKSDIPYNMVTSAFMHGDFNHWLNNSMLFAVLSPMVERTYGKVSYLLAFLFTCWVDSLYQGLVNQYGIGMSAFVFALFMLNLMADSKHMFSICGLFVVVTYGGQELMATGKADGIGHMNHFIGMASGALFAIATNYINGKLVGNKNDKILHKPLDNNKN